MIIRYMFDPLIRLIDWYDETSKVVRFQTRRLISVLLNHL